MNRPRNSADETEDQTTDPEPEICRPIEEETNLNHWSESLSRFSGPKTSQSGVDRLTLEREYAKYAFVDASKRFPPNESIQTLDAKGEFSNRKRPFRRKPSRAQPIKIARQVILGAINYSQMDHGGSARAPRDRHRVEGRLYIYRQWHPDKKRAPDQTGEERTEADEGFCAKDAQDPLRANELWLFPTAYLILAEQSRESKRVRRGSFEKASHRYSNFEF